MILLIIKILVSLFIVTFAYTYLTDGQNDWSDIPVIGGSGLILYAMWG